jgi:hypothetical protein
VAIPVDRNVMQKEAETKYKSLRIEVQWVWNMKCIVIPVIIGATRIGIKGLKKSLEAIWDSVDLLQKTAICGTSHIMWKVLHSATWSLSERIADGSRGEVPGRKGLWQEMMTRTCGGGSGIDSKLRKENYFTHII